MGPSLKDHDSADHVGSGVKVKHSGSFRWEGVSVLPYKEDGTHFKSITRQVLFQGGEELTTELRYFEIGPGGHSTLERHHHEHAVVLLTGSGRVLVGDQIFEIQPMDLVHVPPMTWHQFQNTGDTVFGFLCVVNVDRDRPQRPNEDDLAGLRSRPEVAQFIKV